MRRRLVFGIVKFVTVLVAGIGGAAQGAITWNVNFLDVVVGTGIGFDDPTLGATRRATVGAVTGYISSTLAHNGTIDLDIEASEFDGTGFLASAGTSFSGSNGFTNGFAFQRATTGVDPNPGSREAYATFDFGYNWNSGLGAPGGSEFDLFTVALHEITHSLGFLTLSDADGNSVFGGSGLHSVLDSFLDFGVGGVDLFGGAGTYLGNPGDLTSGNVYFSGLNANAANGGTPIEMYSPVAFAPGSSLSHIDLSTHPSAVMNHAVAAGVQKREWTALDLGILQDLGYSTLLAIPEPTRAMVVLLGLAAAMLRRRRLEI